MRVDRRQLLAAGGAWAALPGLAQAAEPDLKAAAREAWLYCLPLIEMAGTRARATGLSPAGKPAGVNEFRHSRNLAGPASRAVTTPNNDTLYSSAWIDLAAGPVTVTLPATGPRYFSLALMDMFTNNFAVLGARTTGGEGGTFVIVGPRDAAPAGAIRSPTPWVWALARTLVDGPADLDAARAVQDGLTIRGRPGRIPDEGAGRAAAWSEYFQHAQLLLAENPPPATDAAVFRRIRPMQLRPGHGFETARFADTEVGEIEAGVAEARAALAGQKGAQHVENGWVYPKADLGDFGQDYLYRAAVALGGLAALPVAEAMYMRPMAPDGGFVFSGGHYRLSLPAALPVDGFWSLTMYEATPQGQFFLTENALSRYAIGDRTPGLVRDAAGGLDIWIGREDPGGARSSNWLPAPAQGPFALTLRAYLPKAELLDGRYRLPALSALGGSGPPPPAPPPPPSPPPPTVARRRRR
jgi:hypothetical protein